MSSKLDIDLINDLIIKKSIYDRQQRDLYEENNRVLRIENPYDYDYNNISRKSSQDKENRRVIIIDI